MIDYVIFIFGFLVSKIAEGGAIFLLNFQCIPSQFFISPSNFKISSLKSLNCNSLSSNSFNLSLIWSSTFSIADSLLDNSFNFNSNSHFILVYALFEFILFYSILYLFYSIVVYCFILVLILVRSFILIVILMLILILILILIAFFVLSLSLYSAHTCTFCIYILPSVQILQKIFLVLS